MQVTGIEGEEGGVHQNKEYEDTASGLLNTASGDVMLRVRQTC
jgi:hypothetical protein